MGIVGKGSFDIGALDTLAAGDSALHRLDPRAKLVTTLAFIVAVVSFDKYALSAMTPFLLYPAVLIALGGLPARYFVRKMLIVAPFAVVVGIFNPLLDRETMVRVGSVGISGGWISFLSILLRFALTVSAAFILIALTGFNAVCLSLEKIGVPRPFVVQLMFLYRYLFVLTDESERMDRARSFRSVRSGRMGLSVFVPFLGHLLLRTLERAERIYIAMRCRGFRGHVPVIVSMRFGVRETAFVAGWTAVFVLFRQYPVAVLLGSLITGAGP